MDIEDDDSCNPPAPEIYDGIHVDQDGEAIYEENTYYEATGDTNEESEEPTYDMATNVYTPYVPPTPEDERGYLIPSAAQEEGEASPDSDDDILDDEELSKIYSKVTKGIAVDSEAPYDMATDLETEGEHVYHNTLDRFDI